MQPSLQTLFDSVEREKDRLLDDVSALSPEDFFRTPAPGKWSVAQIMTHLMTVEQLSLQYMKKKSLGINEVKDSGVMEEARFRLYSAVFRLPLKLKAPRVILDNTPEALPLSELEVQWKRLRNKLKTFLSTIEDKHIRRLIYKHAFAGRLDITQALRFFIEHIYHHQPQVDRIVRSSKR